MFRSRGEGDSPPVWRQIGALPICDNPGEDAPLGREFPERDFARLGPLNRKRKTSNIEHPRTRVCAIIGCWAFDVGCWLFPRFRGRVGVRGNGPYSNLTSQTLAGTAKRYESSGRVGGLPSGPTRSPAANLLHGKASAAWEPAPPINTQLQFLALYTSFSGLFHVF